MSNELVVLDAGHGGQRSAGRSTPFGARGPRGTLEKDVTLQLARRVAAQLGPGAVLTRDGDANRTLAERIEVASRRGAAVFVSLHAGGAAPTGGAEAFVHPRAGGDSRSLAQALCGELSSYGGPGANVGCGELAVLAPERLPRTAACLLEVDTLATAEGEARLRDPRSLERIASAIARGVRRYLGRYGRAARALDQNDPNADPARDAEELRQRIEQIWGSLEEQAKQALLRQLQSDPGSVIAGGVLLGAAGVAWLLNSGMDVPSLPGIPLDFISDALRGIELQPVIDGPLDDPRSLGFRVTFHERPAPPRAGDRPAPEGEVDIDGQLYAAGTSIEQIARQIDGPEFETETPGRGPQSNLDSTDNLQELVRVIGGALLQETRRDRARPWLDLRNYFVEQLPAVPSGFGRGLRRIVDALIAALPDRLSGIEQVSFTFAIGGRLRWIPVIPSSRAAAQGQGYYA